MRNTLLPILLLLLSFASQAQKFSFKEPPALQFAGPQEQQAFEKLAPLTLESQFNLLYLSSPEAALNLREAHMRQLKDFIAQLSPKVEKAKGSQKKIKLVHREVHDTFLKKYVLVNHFADVFSKGEYNCVSATALYALVLQQLSIPYVVKETPSHVFLVTYPATERIALESTDPQVGYLVFNNKFKSEYVAQLRKMKLISEHDYQTKGYEKLFDEMYFQNQDISLKELIALQYYNGGLYLLEKDNWENALQQFEKGYALYPCDRGSFLIYNSLLGAKEKKNYSDSAYIGYIIKLANITGPDNHQEHLRSEFVLFTDDQLSNKGRGAYYDKMYHKLAASISKDSSLVNEISFIYYFEKGRTAFGIGQYSEALKWSEQAYKLKPDVPHTIGLLMACIGQRLQTIYSIDEQTLFMEGYFKKYPSLEDHNALYSQLLQLYLVRFGQAYELEQEKKGMQYRQIFEQAYQRKKGGTETYMLDNQMVGRAYAVAAVYYFRRGQNAQARQLINKGLEIDPYNHELLQRRQMIR